MTRHAKIARLTEELDRLGALCSHAEPTLVAIYDNPTLLNDPDKVMLADDQANAIVPLDASLNALSALPDDADYESVWGVIATLEGVA